MNRINYYNRVNKLLLILLTFSGTQLGFVSICFAQVATPRAGSVSSQNQSASGTSRYDSASSNKSAINSAGVYQAMRQMPEQIDPVVPGDQAPYALQTPGLMHDSAALENFSGPTGEPCNDEPAYPWSSGEWFRTGKTYYNLDFVSVHRTRKKQRLTLGQDITQLNRGLTLESQPWGLMPAVRGTIGRYQGRDYLNRDHSWEFTFLGINEGTMNDGIQSINPNSLVTPLAQLNTLQSVLFNNTDIYTYQYDSRILSGELNYTVRRRPERDRMLMGPDGNWTRQSTNSNIPSFIIGARYLSINEDFVWKAPSLILILMNSAPTTPLTRRTICSVCNSGPNG